MDKTRKPYPQKARERIAATKIITKLQKCVEGDIEMDAQQVAAARILLSKVLPDLKATEFSGETKTTHSVDEMTLEQAMKNVLERTNPSK